MKCELPAVHILFIEKKLGLTARCSVMRSPLQPCGLRSYDLSPHGNSRIDNKPTCVACRIGTVTFPSSLQRAYVRVQEQLAIRA
jgi:hypothetical protein